MDSLLSGLTKASVSFGLFVICWVSVVEAQPNTASSNPRTQEVLDNIEKSLTSVSYSGIYTYEHTGVMDSIKVTKLVGEDKNASRVEHLSGKESKAIIRQENSGVCGANLAQRQSAFDADNLSRYYQFEMLGQERIAGRNSIMLQARPLDEFRFGYQIAVDEATGVPLLLALVNGNRLVERFQFVDFTPLESSSAEQLEVTDLDHAKDGGCFEPEEDSRWAMRWLPGGFKLVSHKSDNGTDMYSYSDGLSRVSVFVSAVVGGTTLEGEARRGATIVYLDKVVTSDRVFQVSVVGEIPKLAAQKMAASVSSR